MRNETVINAHCVKSTQSQLGLQFGNLLSIAEWLKEQYNEEHIQKIENETERQA